MILTSRAEVLEGKTVRLETGRGKVYVTMNRLDERLHEVFITHGKAGGNDAAMAEALSRLISLALQAGASPAMVVKQLQGISDIPVWNAGRKVLSLPDAVAQIVASEISEPEEKPEPKPDEVDVESELKTINEAHAKLKSQYLDLPCPDCKWYTLVVQSGCTTCATCGYSGCE